MPRVVLILPTETYRATAFVEAASSLGAEVLVASERASPLASEMEDRSVVVDLERPDAAAATIAGLARRAPVDAVVAVDDRGVLIASHAAELLGLAHNPPDAVAATRDKAEMRSVLAAWSVPQPAFRLVRATDDPAALAAEVGYPCVVKPVSLSASVGVIRADTPAGVVAAATRVRRILADQGRDPTEPLLVEEFLAGPEVAVEGLLRGGQLEVLAVFDKPDPLDGPYFEETLYVTPSRLPEPQLAAVRDVVATACRALGLREGPVHAEARVRAVDGVPHARLLEVAARSIGGLCARTLRFGAGISLEEVIVRHALGRSLEELRRTDAASGVMMLPIPRSGILREVTGADAARAVPGVVGLELTIPAGHRVEALPEGSRYLGFAFARGDTPAEVEASLRAAHAALEVRLVDEGEAREGAAGSGQPPDGSEDGVVVRIDGSAGRHR